MKLLEKYISMQERKPVKRSLLHTYLISLLTLCLSVTMLLGTTMAWFTSGVEVQNNEIYVGVLDVDLLMKDEQGKDVSLKPADGKEQPRIFESGEGKAWYPGRVETRTFTVVNQGEIPFTYKLSFLANAEQSLVVPELYVDAGQLEDDFAEFLNSFLVYNMIGGNVDLLNVNLMNEAEWECIGTLAQICDGGVTVFSGESEKMKKPAEGENAPETQAEQEGAYPRMEHTIAVQMAENAEDKFQGFSLNFNVKLVANQLGTPEQVSTAKQLLEALESGRSVQLMENIDLSELAAVALDEEPSEVPEQITSIPLNNVMIDGNERNLSFSEETDSAIYTTGGTIRNLTILGGSYEKSCAVGSGKENPLTGNLYLDHVTIDNVKTAIAVDGNGKSKVVVTNSMISGAINCRNVIGVDFVDCALGETDHAFGSMTVSGNTSFTNCNFVDFTLNAGEIPENTTVTFTNCMVNGEKVTADVLMTLLNINGKQSNDWSKCTFIIDGVTRTVS